MSQQELSKEIQEIWASIKEIIRRQDEMDKRIEELSKQVEQREPPERIRPIDTFEKVLERILSNTFIISPQEILMDNLYTSEMVNLFRERGIEITRRFQPGRTNNVRTGDEPVISLVADGEECVIAFKVRNTLKKEWVDEHIEDLANFRKFFPYLADKKLLGAVAGIVIEEGEKMSALPSSFGKCAYRRGLFVITQAGENIKILNDEKFRPKEW
jgi:hypothetical protein